MITVHDNPNGFREVADIFSAVEAMIQVERATYARKKKNEPVPSLFYIVIVSMIDAKYLQQNDE
jgi:hypothetical protein